MRHPRFVRFFIASLQEPDGIRRQHIMRTWEHEPATRDQKIAELDARRERDKPVLAGYVMAGILVALPFVIIALLLWPQ